MRYTALWGTYQGPSSFWSIAQGFGVSHFCFASGHFSNIIYELSFTTSFLNAGPGFSQSSSLVTDNFEDMEYVDSSGEKEYLTAFVIPKVFVGVCMRDMQL
jgi:hypothetical protein